jgi:hypothetical protein
MTSTTALGCRCGKVKGTLSDVAPDRVNHVRCYCDDCRAFAHFLERSDQLDRHGGVGIVQVEPSRVQFTEGREQLRCMRLTEGGMNRWYSDCCKTPMGNTMGARVPFVGLFHGSFERVDPALLGVAEGCNARFAIGSPPGAHKGASARLALKTVRLMARWALATRGKENPYFDPATKRPRVEPTILSRAERDALRARDADVGDASI